MVPITPRNGPIPNSLVSGGDISPPMSGEPTDGHPEEQPTIVLRNAIARTSCACWQGLRVLVVFVGVGVELS